MPRGHPRPPLGRCRSPLEPNAYTLGDAVRMFRRCAPTPVRGHPARIALGALATAWALACAPAGSPTAPAAERAGQAAPASVPAVAAASPGAPGEAARVGASAR